MAISDKLTYLNTTKLKLKDTINYTGAGIDGNTTFRNYDKKLYDGLVSALIDKTTLFNNMPKLGEQTGTSITLNNSINAPMKISLAPSELSQSGTPSPSSPQEVHTINKSNNIIINNNDNTESQTLKLFLGVENLWTYKNIYTSTSASQWVLSDSAINLPAGTYTISLDATLNENVLFNFKDASNVATTVQYNNTKTITFTSDIKKVAVNIISAGNTISNIQIEKGNVAHDFTPYGQAPLEYCKIGDYSDEFYLATSSDTTLEEGKWYLKKNIGKAVLDGSENWSINASWNYTNTNAFIYALGTTNTNLLSNYFVKSNVAFSSDTNGLMGIVWSNYLLLRIDNTLASDTNAFKTWLSTHNTTVYFPLTTPTYTLLDDTLQIQLTNIYNNALSYEGQTNISQTNADLPFVITANGIKAYDNI